MRKTLSMIFSIYLLLNSFVYRNIENRIVYNFESYDEQVDDNKRKKSK